MKLEINGKSIEIPEAWREARLLWWLRDGLGLIGTRFGCGVGACGACTVHVDDAPQRSCLLPVSSLEGRRVRTIEGLADPDGTLHPVQQAWIDESVPQCGYCQAGQIMSAAALLESEPAPDDERIERAMSGNLCRCGTYARIRKAIRRAAEAQS
ncbi:MAG: (2Fe-2S)-binding protein [bacterium]|nr:(2Fe-2S)-binding protein [bacterium]